MKKTVRRFQYRKHSISVLLQTPEEYVYIVRGPMGQGIDAEFESAYFSESDGGIYGTVDDAVRQAKEFIDYWLETHVCTC